MERRVSVPKLLGKKSFMEDLLTESGREMVLMSREFKTVLLNGNSRFMIQFLEALNAVDLDPNTRFAIFKTLVRCFDGRSEEDVLAFMMKQTGPNIILRELAIPPSR